MSARSVCYGITRPRVMVPAAIGLGLIVVGGWKVAGFILLGIAALKLSRILSWDDLDDRLVQRAERRNNGVWRPLFPAEQSEMEVLQRYADGLREAGADLSLARETLAEAWKIVARAGQRDAANELRAFRQSLPPLPEVRTRPGAASLADRINAELDLLRATRKEVENLS